MTNSKVPMNAAVAAVDGLKRQASGSVDPESRVYSLVREWHDQQHTLLTDQYSQLKRIFDAYHLLLRKKPSKWYQKRTTVEFNEVLAAMASSGMTLSADAVDLLLSTWMGETIAFTFDRMQELRAFALRYGIYSDGNQPVSHVQWVALHRTQLLFKKFSEESILSEVMKRQFGERYAMLARAFYHLLRRELNRKPGLQDYADAMNSSIAVDGKQDDVIAALERLMP